MKMPQIYFWRAWALCGASHLAPNGSLNRCVCGFAIASPKILAPLGTSDVRKTLDEIVQKKE